MVQRRPICGLSKITYLELSTGTNEDEEDMSFVMTMKGGTLRSWWVPFHWKMPGYKGGELDIQGVKTTELDSTWCYGVIKQL